MPRPPLQARAWCPAVVFARRYRARSRAHRTAAFCGSCTSARAISVRLASPEDICANRAPGRCAIPGRRAPRPPFQQSGIGRVMRKMRVLPEISPERTTSRPVASLVQMPADRRDDASSERAQKRSSARGRIEMEAFVRDRIAFPRDGFVSVDFPQPFGREMQTCSQPPRAG